MTPTKPILSNTAVTVRNPKELLEFLTRSRSAIAMALPSHLNPDRMIRLAQTKYSTDEKIRQCTPISILESLMVAAQSGLEPGVQGQGYLIPYGKRCTFVPGWQGLVGLLNNTGRATAWTGSVFEGDTWEFTLGSNPKCVHVPGENYGDPKKLIWVYACGKVNGSEVPVIEAWPMSRVWKHRDQFNKVGQQHYSYAHPEMYARKVVVLQVLKYMPRSIELSTAMTAAHASEMGKATRMDEGVIVEIDPEDTDIPQQKPVLEVRTVPKAPVPPPPPPTTPVPAPPVDDDIIWETATPSKPIPAEPPAPSFQLNPEEPRLTPQTALKNFLDAGNVPLDAFVEWAKGSGRLPLDLVVKDYDDVPADRATKLMKEDMLGLKRLIGKAQQGKKD